MNDANHSGTYEAATETRSDGELSAGDTSARGALGGVPPSVPTVRDAVASLDVTDDLSEIANVVSDIERTLRRIRVWVAELTDSVDAVASRALDAEHALKKASSFAIDLEEMGFARRRDE